jgi:hypothetical protein
MDKRFVKIIGLKALLLARETEATFCDISFAGTPDKIRSKFRAERVQQIDRANKETCLSIAGLYEQIGNKNMSEKYWTMAKRYAHMGVGAL